MGVFGDWAQNYYDLGYSAIPVDVSGKGCLIKGWTEKFSHRFPNNKEQELYIEKYGSWHLGIATGESSGVVGIDFDYAGPDAEIIESLVLGALPACGVIKKGNKGWTRFYKYDGSVKNKSIDRFGQRMIDVLSTGRLTVMPPSPHPKPGVIYKWLSEDSLLDIDSNELTELRGEHVKQLEEISLLDNSIHNEFGLGAKPRHDYLVGAILRQSDLAKDLDDLTQKILEADINAHTDDKKGPYFHDKKYNKGRKPYEACRTLCERVCDWKKRSRKSKSINWDLGKYPRQDSQGKSSRTGYEDFKSFFEFSYPRVRFCKVKRTTFHWSDQLNKWLPIDNFREVIESEASEIGLSPSYVNRHLQRWVSGFKPTLLIDLPRWGGDDLLGEMVSKLEVSNIPQHYVVELFKEWAANIFNRLGDSNQQNRMIVLKGGQGIGKDNWINHLFKGLGPYFSEIELQERKIENYQTVSDLLVANIPEFDETHKISISTLKSLVTSPGATFRASYARKSDYVPFYVSYISSCNFDHILRDSSGNRRYLVFEVDSIKWDYKDKIDPVQLLAQMYHMSRTGFKASPAAYKCMKSYIDAHTPDDLDTMILEDCLNIVQSCYTFSGVKRVRWGEISEEIGKLTVRYRVSLRRIQQIMKNNGVSKRDEGSTYYAKPD